MPAKIVFQNGPRSTTFDQLAVGDWFIDNDGDLCVKLEQGGGVFDVNCVAFGLDTGSACPPTPVTCSSSEPARKANVTITVED